MPQPSAPRVSRARELGAVLASDECYAELGWDAPWDAEPIPSALDPRVTDGDVRGILSVYSLSKQSNLAGYRAAFLAGDPGHRRAARDRAQAPRSHAAGARAVGDDRRARRRRARRRAEGALPRAARAAQARGRAGRLPHRRERGRPLPLGDRGSRRVGEPRRASPISASSPVRDTSTARTSPSTCACR